MLYDFTCMAESKNVKTRELNIAKQGVDSQRTNKWLLAERRLEDKEK